MPLGHLLIDYWEILTNTFRELVNNLFKESFYGKKKTINVLIAFLISSTNGVKFFLKVIINQYLKQTR